VSASIVLVDVLTFVRYLTAMAISEVEFYVLAAMSADELYGREIADGVAQLSEGRRTLSVGALYTTLHRMEKKGLISGRWGNEGTAEGARRRYYSVTALGHAAVGRMRRALSTSLTSLAPGRA
jgi:PadR family transcriptional regulator PadR